MGVFVVCSDAGSRLVAQTRGPNDPRNVPANSHFTEALVSGRTNESVHDSTASPPTRRRRRRARHQRSQPAHHRPSETACSGKIMDASPSTTAAAPADQAGTLHPRVLSAASRPTSRMAIASARPSWRGVGRGAEDPRAGGPARPCRARRR